MIYKDGREYFYQGKILKPDIDKGGYLQVVLSKNSELTTRKIHRLVASAFVVNNNPKYTQINHIDENKENNVYTNLEWCDADYNNEYGTRTIRAMKSCMKYAVKVIATNKCSNEKLEFESIREASRELNIDRSDISKCIKGKIKSAGGYYWKYK